MYRFNLSVHFFTEDDKLTLLCWTNKLSISQSKLLYDFFVYCVKYIHVWLDDLDKYGISPALTELLMKYKVLLQTDKYQSWAEALYFHWTAGNPNKLSTYVQESDVAVIYSEFKVRLSKIVNIDSQRILSFNNIHDLQAENINLLMNESKYSTRLLKKNNIPLDLDYLYSSVKYIHGNKDNHYVYGSWGWLYSVFSLIITSNDEVMIVDNHKQLIYQSEIIWIFSEVIKSVLVADHYDPKEYNIIVITLSDTLLTFQKYWNKWYRFMMMESGVIWFLWRILYSKRWYLEIGWYKDKELFNVIKSFNIFKDMTNLIIAHLILLSH